MKKILLIGLLIFALALSACGESKEAPSKNNKTTEEKLNVTVTTSFLYDMVKELAGDLVHIHVIVPAGEDPHLYVAKPQDLDKIQNADLLLYHGMHFEGKMSDILEEKGHSLSENFPKEKVGTMDEDGHQVIDPHFWFDIDLYKMAVQNASDHLMTLLPDNKSDIEKNTESYLKQLDELKAELTTAMESIPQESRYLITPHDAFNYFSRSFNIPVMAPQGVSTDSEVANKDIDKTVDFIVQNKVKAIFAESTTDSSRMDKLQEACKAKGFEVKVVSGEGNELFSDSLAPLGEKGDTYIDMYRHNVKLIVDNLK